MTYMYQSLIFFVSRVIRKYEGHISIPNKEITKRHTKQNIINTQIHPPLRWRLIAAGHSFQRLSWSNNNLKSSIINVNKLTYKSFSKFISYVGLSSSNKNYSLKGLCQVQLLHQFLASFTSVANNKGSMIFSFEFL